MCKIIIPQKTGKVNNLCITVDKPQVIHKRNLSFGLDKKQNCCFYTPPPKEKGSCQNLFHKKRRFSKNNLSTTPGGNMFSTICSNFILFLVYQSIIWKSFVDKNKTTLGKWNIKILPSFFPNTIPGNILLLLFFYFKTKIKEEEGILSCVVQTFPL